ncbi:MAG: DNA adenine methylase [bacterium]|nr:DNA adenine methylase [bacterium]
MSDEHDTGECGNQQSTAIVARIESGSSASSSAFGYYGSKQRLAVDLLKFMPPHSCWVELFGGALALTLAKKPAQIEVVNDLDDNVVNALRQMRDNGEKLAELIELTPYARSELKDARHSSGDETELERARKFLVQAMMSVNGVVAGKRGGFSISDAYARQDREARVNRWYNYPERVKVVSERLRGVRMENKDGVELLVQYSNRPGTLVYIDPPYLADRGRGYSIEASDQRFHERLLSQALLCKCMVMISGYESRTYVQLLENRGGWFRAELEASTQTTNGDRLGRRELLWMNKSAEHAWRSGKPCFALTKKEKKDGKVNPTRGQVRRCRRVWRVE